MGKSGGCKDLLPGVGIPEPSRLAVKPKATIGALGFDAHYWYLIACVTWESAFGAISV